MHDHVRPLVRLFVVVLLLAACRVPAPTDPITTPTLPAPSATAAGVTPTATVAGATTPPAGFVVPSPAPFRNPPADLPTRTVTTRDGIRVELTIDQPVLWLDRPATVTATVENTGRKAARWTSDGCAIAVVYGRYVGDHWIGGVPHSEKHARFKALVLEVFGQAGNGYLDFSFVHPEPRAGPGCVEGEWFVHELDPGERHQLVVTWPAPEQQRPIPWGPVEIVASFDYDGPADSDPDATRVEPVEARLDGWIQSDDPIDFLSPGQAVDAVLADVQFSTWLDAQPEELWGNATRTLDLEAGTWEIGLFALDVAMITIDARTGRVTERRFGWG